jgi:hypothetical protein
LPLCTEWRDVDADLQDFAHRANTDAASDDVAIGADFIREFHSIDLACCTTPASPIPQHVCCHFVA